LQKIKDAAKPGYSKILMYESVIPERVRDMPNGRMAALDLNMMSIFAALERSEGQWRQLLRKASLDGGSVRFWEFEGNPQRIVWVDV
jgi:hypothetical protein